jgi:hypothetical protein
VTTYQPKCVVPSSWYTIGGKKYFVSDISHDVTRFREVTIFTIVGTEGSLTPSDCSLDASTMSKDESYDNGVSKVEEEDKKAVAIRKEAAENSFYHPMKGKHKLKDSGIWKDMETILPDKKKAKESLSGIIEKRVAK